ncbi:E3 ubiquitin-protein ligase SIAH1A-like [Aethina tumida]|uniref:E3 ubiquitin-protein ligase SIAH1A-like n=1 Tax=Aethina tumida TaxID=116153 RepID=UPI002148AF0B|nr:E3 ubiquitin-protein ligase SIAH1A-like [Aethina tumida]
MSQVNYNLICEFECSVCFNYMQPPMNMCSNGHIYCGSCFAKISRCPMCRGCKQGGRNLCLELLFEKLYFPCKYADLGCTFEGLGPAVKEHEGDCGKKQPPCPFVLTSECTWDGALTQLEQHVRNEHRLIEDLTRSYWVPILSRELCWREIVKFDEALFLLTFCGDVPFLHVGVYVLTSVPDKEYNFQFTFFGNGRRTGVAGTCSSFDDFGKHKINKDNRISFPLNVLNKLLIDGKLFYVITIKKK